MAKIHVDGLVPARHNGLWSRESSELSPAKWGIFSQSIAAGDTVTIEFPATVAWFFLHHEHRKTYVAFDGAGTDARFTVGGNRYWSAHIEIQSVNLDPATALGNSGTERFNILVAYKDA